MCSINARQRSSRRIRNSSLDFVDSTDLTRTVTRWCLGYDRREYAWRRFHTDQLKFHIKYMLPNFSYFHKAIMTMTFAVIQWQIVCLTYRRLGFDTQCFLKTDSDSSSAESSATDVCYGFYDLPIMTDQHVFHLVWHVKELSLLNGHVC